MWTYHVALGDLYDVHGERIATGYSGFGIGKNSLDYEAVHDVGPIPRGWYRIGPAYDSPHCGPVTMNLNPLDSTNTFGRDSFRIHGDNATHDASHGCVILDRPVREALAASVDRSFQVVA